ALLAGWAADALAGEPNATSAELAQLYSIAGHAAMAFTHARRAAYRAAEAGANSEVQRLLGLALTVAPDPASRAQVDALLAAFGSGRRLLAPPSNGAGTADASASSSAAPTLARPAAAPGATDEPTPATISTEKAKSFATRRLYLLTGLLV